MSSFDESEIASTVPRARTISHETISTAVDLLLRRYRLRDGDVAFGIIRNMAQTSNVKVRALAAEIVLRDSHSVAVERAAAPIRKAPAITFGGPGWSAPLNRGAVLAKLMAKARQLADAPQSTVQSVDVLHGGLFVDKHFSIDRAFLDEFSYLDAAETSCGSALLSATQVVVPDVGQGGLYDEHDRSVMLAHGARCVVSTPLRDRIHRVVGVVTTHHPIAGHVPDAPNLQRVQECADEAGRWLEWHRDQVMPLVVDAVHRQATALRG